MADAGDLFDEGRRDSSADDLETRLAHAHLHATMFGGAKPVMLGHYRIVERIGAGGMGVVYRAIDERSEAAVALKTLPRADPELLYRLKREFRTLCRIGHPNLVPLHELVVDDQRAFFTMQLIDGVAFDQYVRNDDPQRGRLRRALAGLVDGVEALHRAGIIHRDLKPSNALVDRSGHVYILDFGLATEPLEHRSGIRTSEGTLRGTLAYMSPEQVSGRAVDATSDWYAVGVMLYEALVGEVPFLGPLLDTVAAKQSADPPVASDREPHVPPELSRLATALMHRDIEVRADGQQIRAVIEPNQRSRPCEPNEWEVFVGRVDELERLRGLIQTARAGHPVVVAVSGPSGIGKTRLVDQMLQTTALDDASVVLRGRCYEQESVAFKALDPIIDELSRRLRAMPTSDVNALLPRDMRLLSRLFPVLERVPAVASFPARDAEGGDLSELRSRAFRALKELLGRMTDRGPLIVFIDDLQWSDLDSTQLLEVLLAPPDPPGLVLIAAHRGEKPLPEALARARRLFERVPQWGVFDEVLVPRLDDADATDLADALLGPQSRIDARRVCEEAAGNPFLLQVIARHCAHTSNLDRLSLRAVFEAALAELTPAARRLLTIVAVASKPVPAGTALGAGAAETADLNELIAAGWLRRSPLESGAVLDTFHDRIRETVRSSLDENQRTEGHRRLASAYEEAGDAEPEDLALHWDLAGEKTKAIAYAETAAEQASQALAFGRAARLFRFVLDRTDDGDSARMRRLASALGNALEAAWEGPEAAEAFLVAADGADEIERIDYQRRAAACLLASGHVARGLELAKRVLADVGIAYHSDPKRALASTLYWRARLRLRGTSFVSRPGEQLSALARLKVDVGHSIASALGFLDTMTRSASLSSQAVFRSLELGDAEQIARALAIEGAHAAIARPDRPRGWRLIRRAEKVAQDVGADREQGSALIMRGVASHCRGDWQASRTAMQAALPRLRRYSGVLPEVVLAESFCVWTLYYRGEWSKFRREVDDVARAAERQQNLLGLWSVRAAWGPLRYLLDDDWETPVEQLAEIHDALPRHAFTLPHYWVLLARGAVELYQQRYEVLYNRMAANWVGLRSSLIITMPLVRMQMLHLRAAATVGMTSVKRDLQRQLCREAERYGKQLLKLPVRSADAHGLVILAAIDHHRGNDARALRRLEDAEERFLQAEMKAHAAISRLRWAQLLGSEEAEALASHARAVLTAEGGLRPNLLANLVAPGFSTRRRAALPADCEATA